MWDMYIYLDFPDKVELASRASESPYTPRRFGVAKLQLNPTTVLYIY